MKSKVIEKDIYKNVRITAASMSFEGLYLKDEEIELMKKVVRGETTAESEVRRLVDELTVK